MFDVEHGVDDGPLVDLADPGDLLVFGVGADCVGALEEPDVLVPYGEGGDVHAHLFQGKIVGLCQLLSLRVRKSRVIILSFPSDYRIKDTKITIL